MMMRTVIGAAVAVSLWGCAGSEPARRDSGGGATSAQVSGPSRLTDNTASPSLARRSCIRCR